MSLKSLLACALSLLATTGCQSTGRSSWRDAGFSSPVVVPATLEPGTVVTLSFPYAPELDTEQTVSPDGTLSFHLIGEVDVMGRTASGLRRLLAERYAEFLKRPDLNVTVSTWGGRHVFVGGEVKAPGKVDVADKLTLLEALMMAGGPDYRGANVKNVLVIRQEGEQRRGYAVNLAPALAGELSDPFYLQPEDVVYVPRREIVVAGQWVDEHIMGLIPGLVYARDAGPARVSLDTTRLRY